MSRTYRTQPEPIGDVHHRKVTRHDKTSKALFKSVAVRDVRLATEIPSGMAYKKLTNTRGFSDGINQPKHHFG